MSAQHTPGPRFLVMAGADPKDKGIYDSHFGHYGVTFATVSFAHEYSHIPEYGGKMAAEYAERVAAALNACEGIPVEVLKANAAGGLPYSVADQIEARVMLAELLEAAKRIEKRIAYYASMAEAGQPNIEQWAYTDQSGDVKTLREAIAKTTGSAE